MICPVFTSIIAIMEIVTLPIQNIDQRRSIVNWSNVVFRLGKAVGQYALLKPLKCRPHARPTVIWGVNIHIELLKKFNLVGQNPTKKSD